MLTASSVLRRSIRSTTSSRIFPLSLPSSSWARLGSLNGVFQRSVDFAYLRSLAGVVKEIPPEFIDAQAQVGELVADGVVCSASMRGLV
jgi:hypothetical protein